MGEEFDEKLIFVAALRLAPQDREAFLRGVCPDEASFARLQELLSSHASGFPGHPTPPTTERAEEEFDPKDRFGHFRIERELGRGGMGVVYLATDESLDRSVALKVITADLSSTPLAMEALQQEARIGASLKHPGIVPVYQFGVDHGHCFIASEYVAGPTLRSVIDGQRKELLTEDVRFGRSRLLECAATISRVADALDHCHRRNVVHRDVKPSNILMDPAEGPRLTDFGIAQPGDQLRTAPTLEGSYHYMSPEQATLRSTMLDARSDIFSLGVVMFEFITLGRPFEGTDPTHVLLSIRETDAARLRTISRLIPRDLETICQKCLERQPSARYQSAAHVAADLRSWIAGDPILATPPSLARRVRSWGRARRGGLLAAGSGGLALGCVGLWMAVVTLRHAGMGVLEVTDAHQGSAVVATRFASDLTPEEQLELGEAPLKVHLRPGLYRVRILEQAGTLEATALLTPGTNDRVQVNRPSTETVASLLQFSAGDFIIGETTNDHPLSARRPVHLDGFRISPTEVSNREFREYVEATGARAPAHWPIPYDAALDDFPVSDITWNEANAYCRWRGLRLATPSEWEVAAQGSGGSMFPWGPDAKTTLPRDDERVGAEAYRVNARPVRSDPELATPRGVLHMLSNVSEYTEGIATDRNGGVIVKGRSWASKPTRRPSQVAVLSGRDVRSIDVGFRVATTELERSSP